MASGRKISPDSGPASGADSQPDATATAGRQGKPKRRNRIIHSCLECRRRKTKCDRGEPCTHCRTAGQECVYVANPANSDAEFRQKLVELKDAKDALDGSLVGKSSSRSLRSEVNATRQKRIRGDGEVSGEESDGSADDGYLEPTPLAVQDAAYGDDVDDDIDDLGVRIGRMCLWERIGGLYRPKIADEVSSSLDSAQQGSSASASPSTAGQDTTHRLTSPSAGLLFGRVSTDAGSTDHIPPRHVADRLLEQYWNAVHPVARVVHRPSFAQRYETLWECIENRQQVSPSLVAIVSAVLFSAAVSMPDLQVLQGQLKLGTEAALSDAQLLKATKLETLQALVVYMVGNIPPSSSDGILMAKLPTCLDQISRAHSVLTGMLVRLAECMGLHRDPTEFGFTPTECQARRLIWYQICYLDLKTSEIQGPRQFIHYDGYTTQLPLDITNSQTSPGWNDMIFSMIRFECQEMQRRCLTYRNRLDRRRMSLTKALSKIEAFRISMDAKYGPYINASSPGPMQKMAGLLLKLWVSLLYLIPLHRYMNSVTYRVPDRLRQIVLIKGTEALEAAVELESSEELQQWAWYSPAYQQYHTAFLLLVEMFNFPRRRDANRIWRCLDFIFAEPLANTPPLKTVAVNPTVDEIIEHRAVKARYLLTLISERMRAYHQAKRSKLPSHFKESMIVITPQKAGDASDARLPLNYAHGEPEVPGQTQQAVYAPQEPEPISATTEPSHPTNPAFAANSSTSLHTYPRIVENASNMWHTSSGNSSPWIQASYPDVEGEGSTYLHPNYRHQYRDTTSTTSTTSNASVPPSHSDTGDIGVDPQLLEIDWNLWDTIFPPQANDGNLDISDGYAWEPYVPYGYNTSERSF